MVLDISLKENKFFLTVVKEFFTVEPISFVHSHSSLIAKGYDNFGEFTLPGSTLGFNGCLKKVREDEEYFYFEFLFPEQRVIEKRGPRGHEKEVLMLSSEGSLEMQRFMSTVHLLSYYCLDTMDYEKMFREPNLWENQSFSFQLGIDSGKMFVAGNVYPWIKQKFLKMTKADILELEKYISIEMNRFSLYTFGEKIFFEQITITNEQWFIVCATGGVWGDCTFEGKMDRKQHFCSHNCDNSVDQRNLFAAYIAMNTWLREH